MISDIELSQITGGMKLGVFGGFIALLTFVAGMFDGYLRPLVCDD